MTCEFCGEEFNLALSHSLAKPEWRYHLASHLRPDQVEAMLPALAASSLIGQMRHVQELPPTLVYGLEVSIGSRKVEVDVAAFVPDHDWAVVLGEVKHSNRVDLNDIENLEFLRARLLEQGVRCVLMFATLKQTWSPEERAILRRLVERSPTVRPARGQPMANAPLVLTGSDLSRPWGSDDHPWRWDEGNWVGLFGTAIRSCERNLGLKRMSPVPGANGAALECDWADDESSLERPT